MKAESKEEPYTKVEVPTITGRGKPMDVHIENLKEAPWNPRAEITAEDVAELAQSIRENGLLNRLSVVRERDDKGNVTGYIVFAGNRRLAACREAGIKHVPVELFDITLTQAKVLTALENLQRKDVEPIREAGLVEDCLEAGMSGEEIAAKIGKSNAWVTRRRKLLSLPPKVREAAERFPEKVTADALENIALRPIAAKSLDKKIARIIENQPSTVNWKSISYYFDHEEKTLTNAIWFKLPCGGMKERCENCPNRTGAQPDLFGKVEDESGIGRCLDAKCWRGMSDKWEEAWIAENVPEGVEIVKVGYRYCLPKDGLKKKRDKNHPCAYVLIDSYSNEAEVYWGPSKKEEEERRAREEEEERRKSREATERNKAAHDAFQKASGVLSYPREVGELLRPLFSGKCPEDAFRRICEWIASAVSDCYGQMGMYTLLLDVAPLRKCLTKEEWNAYSEAYENVDRDEVDWEDRFEAGEDDEEADE